VRDERPLDGVSAELRRHGLTPRKRLGQNFLHDRSFLKRMLDAAEVGHRDEVLEIGAGTGVLTDSLLERARRVVAVELDDSLVDLLRSRLGSAPNLELWHGNALDFDPGAHFSGPFKLLGNIPYYISGPLIRRFLELPQKPAALVLMVQLEVAKRIIASPGRLSVLGVSVQYYADADLVARVPARAFYPVPRVDSAILRIIPRAGDPRVGPEWFFPVVKAGFGMKRKQIANSLSAGLHLSRHHTQAILSDAAIDATRRAETLSVDEWQTLTRVIMSQSELQSN
jgi:16S rRNA (adenine1518-N6/adenine1519-N6)-dimethyltransferase